MILTQLLFNRGVGVHGVMIVGSVPRPKIFGDPVPEPSANTLAPKPLKSFTFDLLKWKMPLRLGVMSKNLPAEMGEKSFPIDLWDTDNPRSVVNLIPETVANKLRAAVTAKPDLFSMDERALRLAVRPTPNDNRLRLAFWNEYNRAQETGTPMRMVSVYAGIVTQQFWDNHYLVEPRNIAWLITPPAHYLVMVEEALSHGIERMRDILDLPVVDAFGKVNVKLGELQAKIVAMLDQRVKGAVIQKQMNLNVNTSDKAAGAALALDSMEEIQRRLKEIEKRERQRGFVRVEDDKGVIDVSPGGPVPE